MHKNLILFLFLTKSPAVKNNWNYIFSHFTLFFTYILLVFPVLFFLPSFIEMSWVFKDLLRFPSVCFVFAYLFYNSCEIIKLKNISGNKHNVFKLYSLYIKYLFSLLQNKKQKEVNIRTEALFIFFLFEQFSLKELESISKNNIVLGYFRDYYTLYVRSYTESYRFNQNDIKTINKQIESKYIIPTDFGTALEWDDFVSSLENFKIKNISSKLSAFC